MSANLRQSAYRALGGVMLLGITLVQPLVFSAFAEEPAEIRPPEVRFKATDSIGRSLKLTSQLSAKWEVRESRPVLAIHWEGLPGTASALGKSFGSDGEFNGISINSRVGPRSSLILDIQTDARITRVENFEAVMKFEVPESTPTYLSIEDSCTDLGLGIRAPETQAPLVLGLACVRLRGGIVVSRFFTPKELDARPGPRGSGTLIQPGEIEFTRSVSSLKAADEGEVLGEAVRDEGAGTLEVVRVSNRKPLGFSVFRRWHADISAGAAFLSGSNTGQGSLLLRTELLPDALEFVADGSKILKDSLLTAGVRLGFPAASH
ncbi:MAG: hypothetical protein KGQ59_12550, partial [Bdellovibrionales bacterium]|nr:hypothetical protein [Bdellovibrionales bacterium]